MPAVATAPQNAPDDVSVPFVRASVDYVESLFTQAVTPGTTAQEFQFSITPGGFLRGLKLLCTSASGAIGSATLAADYPWIIYSSVVVEDINGSPIFGPVSGYELYLINKYGGYHFHGDPATLASYVGTINTVHSLWIPFEFRSDALGSLANTDARAQYRLRFTINTFANLTGSTGATTAPALSISGFVYTWAQVEPRSLDGLPQEMEPPGLGTTQFWTHEYPVVAASAQVVRANRVGNLIRNLIFVTRTNAAATTTLQAAPRSDDFTDPIRVRLDNRYLYIDAEAARWDEMARKYALTTFGSTRDTGVYVYPFSEGADTHPSPADESNYLTTTEASYLAVEATMANAGTLGILTNDIAPYGQFALGDELG